MNRHNDLIDEIRALKESRQAVLLVHNYQVEEVQQVADHLGDSLELSRLAAELPHPVLVFAGVKFMAETAKVLSPEKKVLLPRLDAGCPMADMIVPEELQVLMQAHPGVPVVTYVNSSVEIKALSDVCCTSANAVEVVRRLPGRDVIFVPDRNLGRYVASCLPEKNVILHEGYCYVHNRIRSEDLLAARELHPGARILAHPECQPQVLALADEVCSTSGMIRSVASSSGKVFILATEEGLLQRIRRENPGKEIFAAGPARICANMKRTRLEDVASALRDDRYVIEVEENVAKAAHRALARMVSVLA